MDLFSVQRISANGISLYISMAAVKSSQVVWVCIRLKREIETNVAALRYSEMPPSYSRSCSFFVLLITYFCTTLILVSPTLLPLVPMLRSLDNYFFMLLGLFLPTHMGLLYIHRQGI